MKRVIRTRWNAEAFVNTTTPAWDQMAKRAIPSLVLVAKTGAIREEESVKRLGAHFSGVPGLM